MIRQLRKKFASSISLIEHEEDFLYSNWLRVPGTNEIPLGNLTSTLTDTSFISFNIKQPFSIAHFFSLSESKLYPEDLSYLFGRTGTNPVFFQLLYVPSRVLKYEDINPVPHEASYQQVGFILAEPVQKGIDAQVKIPAIDRYAVRIAEPKIEDYLQNLKPKVIKVDLLNQNDFTQDGNQTLINEIKVTDFGKQNISSINIDALPGKPKLFKVKVPGMGKYKSKVYSLKLIAPKQPAISKYKPLKPISSSISITDINMLFTETKTISGPVKFDLGVASGQVNNLISDDENKNPIINQLLKRTFNVEWSSRPPSSIQLQSYEEENAKFLAENNRVFYGAEPGLDTKKIISSALQFLFSNRAIIRILLITPGYNSGIDNSKKQFGSLNGWVGSLKNYLPELTLKLIKVEDDETQNHWKDNSIIHLVDYHTLNNDLNNDTVKSKELKQYDCIIIDEAQLLDSNRQGIIDALSKVNPNILWLISTSLSGDVPTSLNSRLNSNLQCDKIKFCKLPEKYYNEFEIEHQEYWLEPDEQQKVEYKEKIVQSRKDLKRILESGNPLHYQSNIYLLLHKLFQAQNFFSKSSQSPKTELLLDQVKSIKENGRQVIIISQYDEHGVKKIERLLDNEEINYVSVSTGYTAEQLRKSITLFKSKKDITVFLTNDKVARLNFGDYFVPYLIRFDSWWNPATVWQLGSLFNQQDKSIAKKTLFVFSYKMLNTIDENIKQIILKKELNERNLVKSFSVNSINELISIEEWVKIFGLPVEDEESKYQKLFKDTMDRIKNSSTADMKELLIRFFMSLGYNEIDFNSKRDEENFELYGKGTSGGTGVNLHCKYFAVENVNSDMISQTISKLNERKKPAIFVITKGKFEDDCFGKTPNNMMLLDLEKLAKYFIVFHLVSIVQEQPA